MMLFLLPDLQEHVPRHRLAAFASHAEVKVESLRFDHHGQFQVAGNSLEKVCVITQQGGYIDTTLNEVLF